MPRIAVRAPEQLDDAARAAHAEIENSRGPVHPIFDVLLHSPEFARSAAAVGGFVRYGSSLPERERHLLGLVAARAQDCQYVFTVHAVGARHEGIPPAVVEALGRDEDPTGLPELEELVVAFARQLASRHRVDDATFKALMDRIDERHMVDIVGTLAYYSLLAFPINAFDVGVRPEHTPELPERAG
jgi:4-carboxymuconolactone decarboxylase